ncbi:GL15647 [Drosophila persimilis]|uniref:GL15647 n=1 Tax=Drosophila persimilis TaxID=7234 RepID=B4IR19_DROPE|nr:GL15647 [Drosophila persimilis]
MIAQFVDDHQNTWDELLPEMTLAINSSVSETTGFSPAFLLQGREPTLSLENQSTCDGPISG